MIKSKKQKKDSVLSYSRKKFNLEILESRKKQLLKERVLSNLKNIEFKSINKSTNLFSILNKTVFIKESLYILDYYQLKDYLKQRKMVSNIPEIYGTLKLKNGKVYVFSKYLPDVVDLSIYLKNNNNAVFKNKMKKEIKIIADKLISKGQLPSDFQLKQLMYSPKEKKIYFCDNAVSFSNPSSLIKHFKDLGLKVPLKLRKLSLYYNLHPLELGMKGVRLIKQKTIDFILNSSENKDALKKIKRKGRAFFENRINKITLETIDFYNSLPLKTKQQIQKNILDNCLKEIDNFSSNFKEN